VKDLFDPTHPASPYPYGWFRRKRERRCPKCGMKIADFYKYCPVCGTQLEPEDEDVPESEDVPKVSEIDMEITKWKKVIFLLSVILIIVSFPIYVIIAPAYLLTFLFPFASRYLGFWGVLLFGSPVSLLIFPAIGVLLWSFTILIILKALKKLGVVKEKKRLLKVSKSGSVKS